VIPDADRPVREEVSTSSIGNAFCVFLISTPAVLHKSMQIQVFASLQFCKCLISALQLVKPRPPSATSIPAILKSLQDEWVCILLFVQDLCLGKVQGTVCLQC